MANVAIIPAHPDEEIRFIEADEPQDIFEVQKWIGGYVTTLALPPREICLHKLGRKAPAFYTKDAEGVVTFNDPLVLCDEEGQLKQLPVNIRAYRVLGYPLLGTVVLMDRELLT